MAESEIAEPAITPKPVVTAKPTILSKPAPQTGRVVQVSVSNGGMPKLPVETLEVHFSHCAGDRSRNKKYHGGPGRVVCFFSIELYDRLRTFGIDLFPGAIGENITTSGIDLDVLGPGSRLIAGSTILEITQVRTPCSNLNQWHPDLMRLIQGHSGWVAKVIQEGTVRAGDAIAVID